MHYIVGTLSLVCKPDVGLHFSRYFYLANVSDQAGARQRHRPASHGSAVL